MRLSGFLKATHHEAALKTISAAKKRFAARPAENGLALARCCNSMQNKRCEVE